MREARPVKPEGKRKVPQRKTRISVKSMTPARKGLPAPVMPTIVQAMGEGFILLDMDGKILQVNPAFLHMSGYSKKDIEGKKGMELIKKMVSEEEVPYFQEALRHALKGGILPAVEFTMVSKKGKAIPVMTTVSTVEEKKGRPTAIISVFKDITERKKIEGIIKESERRYRTLFEESRDAIYITSRKGNLIDFNKSMFELFGYSREEMAAINAKDLYVNHADRRRFQKEIEGKGFVKDYEIRLKRKDGRELSCLLTTTVQIDAKGKVVGYQGIIRDITERRKTDMELREMTDRFEYILGATMTHIDIIDESFTLHYVDPEWQKIYGNPEGRKCYDYFMGRDTACPTCGIPRALRSRQITVTEEVLPREGNRVIQVHTIPFRNEKGEWLVAEFNIDITERKRIEETLQENEERMRLLIEQANDAIFIENENDDILEVNARACELLGYSREELLKMKVPDLQAPEVRKQVGGAIKDEIQLGGQLFEGLNLHRDGTRIPVEISTTRIVGKEGLVLSIVRDIRERKQAEEELRKSEERYRNFVEQSVEGIWLLSFDTPIPLSVPVEEQLRLIYSRGYVEECNNAFAQMYGYTSNKEMIGKRLKDLYGGPPSDTNHQSTLELARNGYRMANRLTEEVNRKGERIYFMNNAVGIIREGHLVGLWGTQRDITEQRRAQGAFLESEKKYRELIEHSLVGNYITQSHIIRFCNNRFAEIFGYSSPEELIGKNVRELVAPESWELVDRQVYLRESGEVDTAQYEFRGKRRDGRIIDLEVLGVRIAYEGKPAIQGTMIDISERKKAEEKLAAIHQMTGELSLTLDATEIANITMDIVQEVLEFGNCAFSLIDEIRRVLSVISYRGFAAEPEHHMRLPLSGGGVTVWVANNGESAMVPDVANDPRYVEWMPNIKSELVVPLKVKERTIGVINVESEFPNAFAEKDMLLLETIASAAAVAIQNARQHEEKLRRIEEMTVFDLAFHDIMSYMDLKVRLTLVVDWATKLLSGKGGGLYLHSESTDDLELVVSHNLGQDFSGIHIAPHEGLSGKVFATKIPMIIDDYPSWEGKSDRFGEGEFHSVVGVPIIWKSDVIGVLTVVAGESERKFSVHDMHLLENFANTTAVMIINARLFEETKKARAQLEFVTDLMSHDLSNINQIALGNMEILADSDLLESQERFLTAARNAVRRSAGLVSNFKVLQKIITQKEEKMRVELSSSIERAVRGVSSYPGKIVSIEYTPASGQFVEASSHIVKAFENLLDNAIKFTPQQHVRVAIDVSEEEGGYTIRIRDWGKGVSGQMKDEIFQRYENLQEGKLGTGLGLYASKKIIENHGGRIWATGNPEGGSIFCVFLPKANAMLK